MSKLVLFACLLILLLSACDYSELGNTVFAAGLSVDKAETGGYEAAVETITMNDKKTGYSPEIAAFEGKTEIEAAYGISAMTSGKLDFRHCRIIMLGEEYAKSGVKELVDTLYKEKRFDVNLSFLVARELTGKEAISTKPLTALSQSFELDSALTNEKLVKPRSRATLQQIYAELNESGGFAVLPAVTVRSSGEEEVLSLDGCAVFKGDKLAFYLDGDEEKLCLMAANDLQSCLMSIPMNDELFAVRLSGVNSRLSVSPDGAGASVSLRVKADAETVYGGSGFSRDELEEAVEKHIKKMLEELIIKVQTENGCDLLGVSKNMRRWNYREWERVEDWGAFLEGAGYSVSCEVRLSVNDRVLEERQ